MSKTKGYIWKLTTRRWHFKFTDPDELDYFNLPFCRRKSGYRSLLRARARLNEYKNEYKIKSRSEDWIKERDPYEDKFVQVWSERKSWKRNSSRRHQWKVE